MAGTFHHYFEGWQKYADNAAGRPPRPLLVDALQLISARDAAIDLGAGALTDSQYLLEQGFASVTALDSAPVAQATADTFPATRFRYAISTFEAFAFPTAAYDVVNAQYALPFIEPAHFPRVFAAIRASLKPGGLLVGQLFGDRDTWAGSPGMNFHTETSARALLADLTLLRFDVEDDANSKTMSGRPKHWHAFHIIARR
ncbi:tellurite resistance protein [Devosia yakushimensis]|uniref:Tellurite resistance protein n=1 Tax=Devosia yakushimensis TaxID=470028 RepID=A0ABQ5UIW5_9HYPH|nr:class I SAM-dependent methyltransferase [Devosia yakushimensis]GLQ11992.1 tellurite resistance protein [Devosia yakushimensis]